MDPADEFYSAAYVVVFFLCVYVEDLLFSSLLDASRFRLLF